MKNTNLYGPFLRLWAGLIFIIVLHVFVSSNSVFAGSIQDMEQWNKDVSEGRLNNDVRKWVDKTNDIDFINDLADEPTLQQNFNNYFNHRYLLPGGGGASSPVIGDEGLGVGVEIVTGAYGSFGGVVPSVGDVIDIPWWAKVFLKAKNIYGSLKNIFTVFGPSDEKGLTETPAQVSDAVRDIVSDDSATLEPTQQIKSGEMIPEQAENRLVEKPQMQDTEQKQETATISALGKDIAEKVILQKLKTDNLSWSVVNVGYDEQRGGYYDSLSKLRQSSEKLEGLGLISVIGKDDPTVLLVNFLVPAEPYLIKDNMSRVKSIVKGLPVSIGVKKIITGGVGVGYTCSNCYTATYTVTYEPTPFGQFFNFSQSEVVEAVATIFPSGSCWEVDTDLLFKGSKKKICL